MAQKTSFYVSDKFADVFRKYVGRHGSPSKAITNSILCLDTMYRLERRVLLDLWEQPEIDLMLDNMPSALHDPQRVVGAMLSSMEDEAQSVYDRFGVGKPAMLKKLRGLTVSQQYALADWLMEMRGDEPEAVHSFHSVSAMKDGKPYMLRLSNDETEMVLKTSGMRDNPERWYLFVCPPEGEGEKRLAETQPEPGEIPDIKELAEANGYTHVGARAFALYG